MTRAYSQAPRPYRLAYYEDKRLVPPQQETFLEVQTRDGIGEVYLDEISEMSDRILLGFTCYLEGKCASLSVEEDLYGYSIIDGQRVANKSIRFKKKIHDTFLYHARQEIIDRKRAKKEWLNQYRDKQKGNEPCQWLSEFGLPTTYSGMQTREQSLKDYSGALQRFINGVKRMIGEDQCKTLIASSGLALDAQDSFMTHLNRMTEIARAESIE
jgi:hypothetical protein